MKWHNERISWDRSQFCGISQVSLPREMLWKPDLFIYEMTQSDESLPSPYLYITDKGVVSFEGDLKVVSSCKLDVHKFPFDTQHCSLTFSSLIYMVDEVHLVPFSNSSRATQFSREVMKAQGEWEFLNLAISNITVSFERGEWDQIIYTVTMRRRPLLYVVNFLLPILFLLCLDLASFFISDHRGEKLGFKVTVLLAVTVMQLILNDILPSMSNNTPLIATFCIVIFGLMLLSLVETILVTHLMERDSPSQESCRPGDEKEENQSPHVCPCEAPGGDTPEEVGSGRPAGECGVLLLILEELRRLQRSQALLLSDTMDGGTPGCWTRAATKINTLFFIFYVVTVSLFLIFICKEWSS
uniref:5-hydroxytryptamine receptor 3E-like n=2 Tax=Myripristis murdjan TaxID=586833 RepID=A0A668A188_9TELE